MNLTDLMKTRLVLHGISGTDSFTICGKSGEGMYSIAYGCELNGQPQLLRLFKKLGPNDQMDRKWMNIQAEAGALKNLKDKGVTQRMVELNVPLREINHTSALFPDDPIIFGARQNKYIIVGYQFCNLIPGQALGGMHKHRADPEFVRQVGEQFGKILAEFHYAAREVDLPRYDMPEEQGQRDHAYRMVRNAYNFTKDKPTGHHLLGQQLYNDCAPLFRITENRTTRIHGDLGLNNILVSRKRISGIVDFDKTRQGHAEYDFLGPSIISGMLDAAIPAYERRASELYGTAVRLDRGLILKFAIAQQTAMANGPDEKVIDISTVGMSVLLDQLAHVESKYTEFATAIRPQAQALEKQRPGIRYEVRT